MTTQRKISVFNLLWLIKQNEQKKLLSVFLDGERQAEHMEDLGEVDGERVSMEFGVDGEKLQAKLLILAENFAALKVKHGKINLIRACKNYLLNYEQKDNEIFLEVVK